MKSFSELLREARTEAGLTQQELADQIGIDPSYISKIERGVYDPPSRDKVLAIADRLGINNRTARLGFLLAASCASLEDLSMVGGDTSETAESPISIPFATGAFYLPSAFQMEKEVLIEEFNDVLQQLGSLETPSTRRELYVDLLRSFLGWLKLQIRERHDQP